MYKYLILIFAILFFANAQVCTQDVFQCPDGTFVSRDPENCEFFPCPSETEVLTTVFTSAPETEVLTTVFTSAPETDLPTEGTDLPTEGTDIPTEGTDIPTEGTDIPTEGTDLPTEGTDLPTEGTEMTEETEMTEGTDILTEGTEMTEETEMTEGTEGTDFTNVNETEDCLYGTLRFGGFCACWSGAFGINCEMGSANYSKLVTSPWDTTGKTIKDYLSDLDAENINRDFFMDWEDHPSCPNLSDWGVVLPLETLNPPRLDRALFENNHLVIYVSQPMVNGRADGAVFLNDNTLNRTLSDCNYPMSQYITKEVDGCRDVWHFDIPWNYSRQCGWLQANEEGFSVYKGQIILHNYEWIENLRVFRFIQSVLRIKIRFQTFVSINLDQIQIYNAPDMFAAITRQIISINLQEDAFFELTTSISFPFLLMDGNLTILPEGILLSSFEDSECDSDSGSCLQRWGVFLTLDEGTCTLDGLYRMNFTKDCRSTFTPCPLSESEKSGGVDFTLTSENFCAEITVSIGLIGELTIYEDESFSTVRTSFQVGRRAYFLVNVNSDANPAPYSDSNAQIKFSETNLVTVTLRYGGNTIVRLYSNGSIDESDGDFGTELNVIDRSEVNMVGFSLIFSNKLINYLNSNGSIGSNNTIDDSVPDLSGNFFLVIGAEIEVSYFDSGAGGEKRVVLEDGSDRSTFSAKVDIDDDDDDDGRNISNWLLVSCLLMIIAIML